MKIKTRSIALAVIFAMFITGAFLSSGYANADDDLIDSSRKGQTRLLIPGDKFVFSSIPPFSDQPTEDWYYEEVTDRTVVAPNGDVVNLNGMGFVIGAPPMVYFAYQQDLDRTIYFYGALVPNPMDPMTFVLEEWVVYPESGFAINYPGEYYIGLEWEQVFDTADQFGNPVASVNLTYSVVGVEKLEVGAGIYYKAFKIMCWDENGELNNISWFAPKLGINIKKISYDPMRPGYELMEYYFND